MERQSRSRRRAFAHGVATTAAAAAMIPAAALADKPAEQRNGPPGPAGNPNHGQAPADRGNGNANGHAQQQPAPPRRPEGRPVRAHGNPPARPQPAPAPQRPARSQRTPQPQRAPEPQRSEQGNNGAAHQKTTLCHATGSDTNPYVEITISDRAVQAHARHQDGRDIIPAPAGGCPTSASAQTPTAEELAAPVAEEVAAVTEERTEATERTGESDVAGVTETSTPRTTADGEDAPASAVAAANETSEAADDGSLPFTGLELLFVVVVGTALLLAGYALRRSRTTA